jgi:hypothetical protein
MGYNGARGAKSLGYGKSKGGFSGPFTAGEEHASSGHFLGFDEVD